MLIAGVSLARLIQPAPVIRPGGGRERSFSPSIILFRRVRTYFNSG
jgi:hypothetical protein